MTYEFDVAKHRYPGIARATLEMAYCNGGINRYRRETDVLLKLNKLLHSGGRDIAFELPAIGRWLASLNDADLQTVVDGEETEMKNLTKDAPNGTDYLLNEIFEEVA